MTLRIVSSSRIAATTVTFRGLPAARSRSAKRRMISLRQTLTAAKNAQKAGELKKAEQHYREEAVKSYREAVRRRPDYLRALNNMGNLLCDLGRFSEAASILRQVIAID